MAQGKRVPIFLGLGVGWGGGVRDQVARGHTHIPLQDAMSKHAMIPCARFNQLKTKPQQGGLPTKKITFHATVQAEAEQATGQSSIASSSNGKLQAAPSAVSATEVALWQQPDC